MICLEHVSKSFKGKTIFTDLNFHADFGEISVLFGKSGIGKSTLLNIIAGLKPIDAGRYFYQGEMLNTKDDKEMSSFRSLHIGYIPQDFALIEDYTVKENLMLPCLYRKDLSKTEIETKMQVLIRYFELSTILNKKVRSLSGGQKQRVAIIRSLMIEPDIILADEPTANLDKENLQLVIDLFMKERENGKIIIIATHDERIQSIANHIYNIKNYRLDEWKK